MAKTLTPKFTLTGSAADWGAARALSVTDTLTCEAPSKGIGRVDVGAGVTTVLYADSGGDGTTFVYVKNNNTSGSGSIDLQIDNGNYTFATLENGEFAWIPIDSNEGLQVLGVTATVEVEYGYWHRT